VEIKGMSHEDYLNEAKVTIPIFEAYL
jgi:hypothetical protein